MRMYALILTVAAATLLIAPASPRDGGKPSRKEEAQKSAEKIKQLQTERIAAAKAMADLNTKLFQAGQVSFEALLDARVMVFEAELDAAEKESDRLALYKNFVDLLKGYEGVAHRNAKAGRGAEATLLKIKAKRLEAEIRLERAKVATRDPGHHEILVTNPKVKDVVITQRYVCRIRSHRHIKIRPLEGGYLEAVPVKEGQAVKTGDVLFKVLPILYKAKLDAELAEVRIAELDLDNAKKLSKDKLVSQHELLRFQAKLVKARARVKLAEAELAFTTVRAPFDGIVGRLQKQQGSLVKEGDDLTTLSDNSVVWAYFNVPEARYLEYMAGLGKDKEAKIELVLAGGSKFDQGGKIGAIESQFDNGTGHIPFRADFPNPDRRLRHGMTGTVLIHRPLKDAVVIPQRATFEILGKRYVYVVGKDDVARRREVVVRHQLEGNFVIDGGVGAADRIIFEGARRVRDGEKVRYEFRAPDEVLGTQKKQSE